MTQSTDAAKPPSPDQTQGLAPDLASDFQRLKDACREAGALALGHFNAGVATERKGDGSAVSEADYAVDALLKERLLAGQSDYGWLSEETADNDDRLSRKRVWIVDPIDGTEAFVNNRPQWVVSAALVEDGAPVLGVVFSPATDEWFEAAAGHTATYNTKPSRCTTKADLPHAVIYGPKSTIRPEKWPEPWPPVELKWANSIAYRVCLVAAGKADASISLTPKNEWDMAAADIIIRCAGGTVTNHLGEPYTYNRPDPRVLSVVAAGNALYPELIERTKHLKNTTN